MCKDKLKNRNIQIIPLIKIDYSGISHQVGESPYERGKDLLRFRHNPFFSPV